jgi:hypothetical protein
LEEKTYEASQRFIRAFEEWNGSTFCPELLGCNISTPEGLAEARQKGRFKSRCTKLVRNAVEIVQGRLAGAHGSDRGCAGDAANDRAVIVKDRT